MSCPDIALRPLVGKHDYKDTFHIDIEQKVLDDAHLLNTTIQNFTWENIHVSVKDKVTKRQKNILDNVSGKVEAGMWNSLYEFSISFLTTAKGRCVP